MAFQLEGQRSTKCSSCQAEIVWIDMESGKPMPCDPKVLMVVTEEGKTVRGRIAHFATCPNAGKHRRSK